MKRRKSSYMSRDCQDMFANVPVSDLVGSFLRSMTDMERNKSEPVSFKFDCLKGFLNKFATIFNQAKLEEAASEADRTRFEHDLLDNCDQMCSLLITLSYQPESSQIRLFCLRLILYLTHYTQYHLKFQSFNIKMLIIRIIDLDMGNDETALAIEYIRLLNELHTECIDKPIIYCLLSSIEDSNFRINYYLLETLLEVVIKSPKLACECNVFYDLISYIQNACNTTEFCIELIVQCLIKVADDEECRKMLKLNDLFSNLIAPMIDVDYIPLTYGPLYSNHTTKCDKYGVEIKNKASSEPKLAAILTSCSTALHSILKKTVGIPLFSVLKKLKYFCLNKIKIEYWIFF
jgi:hypothetical protein